MGIMINCPQATGGNISGNSVTTTASGADPIGQGLVFSGAGEWTATENRIEDTHNSALRAYGDPTLIFGCNLIIDPNGKPCMFFSGDDANANATSIINNDCYAIDNANTELIVFGANGGYGVTNHTFQNNLVVNVGTNTTALVYVSDDSTVALDYNDYWRSTDGNLIRWSNTTTYTQAQWADYKTASSQDAHSINADPLFISATDYRLQAGSPAIDAGTDVGLDRDIRDRTVPRGRAQDVGAYESMKVFVPIAKGMMIPLHRP
jgi:hypothetical protein